MNWKASATDWTKSSCLMTVMGFFQAKASGRGTRGGDLRSDIPTQNFTIVGARKIPREVDHLRRLVRGEVLAAEREQLVGRDRRARLRDHVGDDEPLVASGLLGD